MRPPFARTWVVRGHEIDHRRTATIATQLSWIEQLRWAWILDPDWGLLEMVDAGQFFVVRRQVLQCMAPIGVGEPVWIGGAVEQVGRSQVQIRHRIIRLRDQVTVAEARVQGVWLGANRRLARLPNQVRDMGREQAPDPNDWPALANAQAPHLSTAQPWTPPALDLAFRKPSPSGACIAQRTVRHSECDGFGHANHTTLAKWAVDLLDDPPVARIELQYVRELLPGVRASVHRQQVGTDSFTVHADGHPCAHLWVAQRV